MHELLLNTEDAAVFEKIANKGIDSRLEAFVKSKFQWRKHLLNNKHVPVETEVDDNMVFDIKLLCLIDNSEVSLMFRRLAYLADEGDELADDLETNLLWAFYSKEVA